MNTNLRVWMLAIIGCMLLLAALQVQGACSNWGYDVSQPNGPQHWGDLCDAYKTCSTGCAAFSTFSFVLSVMTYLIFFSWPRQEVTITN